MDKTTILSLAPVAVLAAVELLRRYRLKEVLDFFGSEDMPNELCKAEIALSEQDIYTLVPVPMHGRIDQLYQSGDNFIIVDTKRSYKGRDVTQTDIIQLSVYRTILLSKGYNVARGAYIRSVTNGRRIRYIPIELYNSTDVVNLHKSYENISKLK